MCGGAFFDLVLVRVFRFGSLESFRGRIRWGLHEFWSLSLHSSSANRRDSILSSYHCCTVINLSTTGVSSSCFVLFCFVRILRMLLSQSNIRTIPDFVNLCYVTAHRGVGEWAITTHDREEHEWCYTWYIMSKRIIHQKQVIGTMMSRRRSKSYTPWCEMMFPDDRSGTPTGQVW